MSLPRLVVLGTGFGAFNLVKHLRDDYDVVVVSPRNHFLFTPLLPSTTVGTLEFRSIIEPIRHARKGIQFYHANAKALDVEKRIIQCEGVNDRHAFAVGYDVLVIAVGAVSNTYNVPGVAEHALFLKELHDARELRHRIITCFERANLPGISAEERRQLLHFVICGGGPTGVEFAAELNDFLMEDLRHSYPELVAEARIVLVEAGKEILNTFDEKLRKYATDLFRRERISVLTDSPVVKVDVNAVQLEDGSELPYGLLLWSTGNAPTPFAVAARLPKDPKSRIVIDGYFRVKGYENIYALGDCSVIESGELPATSQVAQQQGKYLAKALQYRHLGMLAYIGSNRALADLENFKGRGWSTWLFWRSAYLSRIVSLRNKVLVLFDWMKTQVFGRDISQF
ncbi:MAG: putative dehydrogenase [Bacteroidetes bacterium]|nr:putative dehydrogenase [Bacteroidota bacterium]